MPTRVFSSAVLAAALAILAAPGTAFAQFNCDSPLAHLGPGLQLIVNPSPTAADVDGISDSTVVAGMSSDFALLLMSQPGTYQLFGSYDPSCASASLGYQLAQGVARQLSAQQLARLDSLAVAVAASAVANVNSFGFANTISVTAVDQAFGSLGSQDFVNQVATAIYNYRFTRATGPDNTYYFQLPGDTALIRSYQQYVSAQPFVNQLVTEVKTGQPGAVHQAQLVTYKLYQASQGAYQSVSTLYQSSSAPVFSGTWTDLFSSLQLSDDFLVQNVSGLVSASTTSFTPIMGGPMRPGGSIRTTTYGASVAAFVSGPAQAQGLTTGTQPSNVVSCTQVGSYDDC